MPETSPGTGVVIVGAGTFACNVISYLQDDPRETWNIVGLVDNNPALRGTDVLGYPVLGDDDILPEIKARGVERAVLGIGATGSFNMGIRKMVFQRVKELGFIIPTIISRWSSVHESVSLGEGVIIPQHAVLDPHTTVGDNVFLSPFVYLPHHVTLDGHIFVSSFVNFVGGVLIGEETFIGMSASVGRDVGRGCNIYPHTLVMEPVPDAMIAFGNPMRQIPKSLYDK